MVSKAETAVARVVFGMSSDPGDEFTTNVMASTITLSPPSTGSMVTVQPVRHERPVTDIDTSVQSVPTLKICEFVTFVCAEHPLAVPVWLT